MRVLIGLFLALLLVAWGPAADGLFSNTIHGFVQDVQQNPVSLLALLAFKYWLLISTGAITVTSTGYGKRDVNGQINTDSFYADLISQVDSDQCVPRLICSTLAKKTESRGSLHDKIAAAFGEKKPSFPSDRKSPSFVYKYAAFMGQQATTADACTRIFPKCKQTDAQLQKIATLVFESNV